MMESISKYSSHDSIPYDHDNFDQDYYPTLSLADLKKKNLWKRKRDENRSDRKEFRFTN